MHILAMSGGLKDEPLGQRAAFIAAQLRLSLETAFQTQVEDGYAKPGRLDTMFKESHLFSQTADA
jgi:hypothetical protein